MTGNFEKIFLKFLHLWYSLKNKLKLAWTLSKSWNIYESKWLFTPPGKHTIIRTPLLASGITIVINLLYCNKCKTGYYISKTDMELHLWCNIHKKTIQYNNFNFTFTDISPNLSKLLITLGASLSVLTNKNAESSSENILKK